MILRQAQDGARPVFGARAAIDPVKLMLLPPAMQGEGVRLMLERGETVTAVAMHLHLPEREIRSMAERGTPFQRGGEAIKEAPPAASPQDDDAALEAFAEQCIERVPSGAFLKGFLFDEALNDWCARHGLASPKVRSVSRFMGSHFGARHIEPGEIHPGYSNIRLKGMR